MQLRISRLELVLIFYPVELRRLEIIRAKLLEPLDHVGIKQRVVVIDVERLVPVLVDVIGPVEVALNDPAAFFPAQDGRLARNDAILKQTAVEAVAFVAPFLIVVTQEGESSRLGRVLTFVGAAVAVTLQATYSLVSRCGFFPSDPTERICFLFG